MQEDLLFLLLTLIKVNSDKGLIILLVKKVLWHVASLYFTLFENPYKYLYVLLDENYS
jgi:hypothetical protein